MIILVTVVALIVGFLAGALVFRRHGDRIEADAAALSAAAKNVADTTKKL